MWFEWMCLCVYVSEVKSEENEKKIARNWNHNGQETSLHLTSQNATDGMHSIIKCKHGNSVDTENEQKNPREREKDVSYH